MTETAISAILDQRRQFLRFIERRVRDEAIAEDILQAAYMRALHHQDEFENDESVVAWFYRVLRNAVIDYYRRRSTEDKALEAWGRELENAVDPGSDTHAEICCCFGGVIENLKPEYADVIRSVDLGQQPLHEFAKEQGLSSSNAGVRAHRARAALRKQLVKTCGACSQHGCLDCTCRKV